MSGERPYSKENGLVGGVWESRHRKRWALSGEEGLRIRNGQRGVLRLFSDRTRRAALGKGEGI